MSLSKSMPKEGEKERRHLRAVMGCFLGVPGEKTKYAATCRHVTSKADSILYIERKGKELLKFGSVLDRNSIEITDKNRKEIINCKSLEPPDIDIFEINENLATICRSVYRNKKGEEVKNCRLYTGDIKDLYGRAVFQCRVEANDGPCFKATVGSVLSDEKHQQYKGIVDLGADFIVRSTEGQFATRGDSGRIVTMEADENTIEIVGMIKAGEFTNPDGQIDNSMCICILLSKGIAYLNKEYGKEFNLSLTDDHSLSIERKIEPGHMILYNTPECTKPTDFVLTKRLLMLIDILKINSEDVLPLDKLIQFENDLNKKVYQRKDLECVQYSTPDQACIQQALIACSKVYSGELEHAEKYLKKACRMVSCNTRFPLRLLCKVYCYATWLMIEMEKIQEVGILLENGIAFMEYHKDNSVFPGDCLGYQYYDHSRYLQTKPDEENQKNAKTRAEQAIEVIEEDKRINGGQAEILALAYANYSHLLLECREHFEGENKIVDKDTMEMAEMYLQKAETNKSVKDSVENIYILKTWGELYFRKNDLETAARYLKTGKEKADDMYLTKETSLFKEMLEKIKVKLQKKAHYRNAYIVVLCLMMLLVYASYTLF